jgi:hypothetical protein
MSDQGYKREEFKVSGDQLVRKVKELVHEGNVRRLQVTHEGRVVLELPLTAVAVGVVIAPVLAAVGAFAALATDSTIIVERDGAE